MSIRMRGFYHENDSKRGKHMYALKDSGVLCEKEQGGNFGYILGKNSYFVNTDYKVLQSQTGGVFIPCMKMLYNGNVELYYVTDGFCPITSILADIAPDTLTTILMNLFANIIEVRNNGFLKCQNLDISWDKLFVDTATLKVRLVYLPVNAKVFDSYAAFESELRANIVNLIGRSLVSPGLRLEQFSEDLRNGSLSLEDVYNRLKGAGASQAPRYQTENRAAGETLRLVAVNVSEYFEIILDRDEMSIGKKAGLVDAVVPFNRLISRKHCRIMRQNGSYYIADEGSANGTYVNRKRITQGQLCPVARGDMIRLANSDFRVE